MATEVPCDRPQAVASKTCLNQLRHLTSQDDPTAMHYNRLRAQGRTRSGLWRRDRGQGNLLQDGSSEHGSTAGRPTTALGPSRSPVSPSAEGRVLVIGAAGLDLGGRSELPLRLGTSNPGEVRVSDGGVARNVAENLARLGMEV